MRIVEHFDALDAFVEAQGHAVFPQMVRERIDDLLVFVTSDRYANLRKQLGIAIAMSS